IAGEQLERIFDMFAQADSSLERRHGGLGIGLALVRKLVELHGGRIDVHSDGLGCGACFTVQLPIGTPHMAEPEAPYAATAAAPLQLLLADDNADSAASLAKLLQLSGYAVTTAGDGLAAVEIASHHRPD